jgi:hypothetical protein
METNCFGPLHVVRAFAPVLAGNGGGASEIIADADSTATKAAHPAALYPTAFTGEAARITTVGG